MRHDIQKIIDFYFENYYEKVHSNLKNCGNFSFHSKLESLHPSSVKYPIVLELGAGNTNHLKFVQHGFDTYLLTDLRRIHDEEIPEVQSGVMPNEPGIYKSIIDARALPFLNYSVDRIVTGCLLLHVDDPIHALDEWLRVLRVGGVIDTFIPNDQSLPVKLYRLLYSRRKARRLGFENFDLVNAVEHQSYYMRIFRLVNAAYFDQQFEFQHYPPVFGNISFLRAYSILRLKK